MQLKNWESTNQKKSLLISSPSRLLMDQVIKQAASFYLTVHLRLSSLQM
uniref:Uncharacterized protein n=1 Tax=Setaria italica TaxID=4555 RepID=K3Y4C1_SETIT